VIKGLDMCKGVHGEQ